MDVAHVRIRLTTVARRAAAHSGRTWPGSSIVTLQIDQMGRGHALVMALLALAASVDGGKPPKQSQASKDDKTAHWKLAALDTAAQEQQIREAEAARDKAATTTVRTFTRVGRLVQAATQEEVGAKVGVLPHYQVGLLVAGQMALGLDLPTRYSLHRCILSRLISKASRFISMKRGNGRTDAHRVWSTSGIWTVSSYTSSSRASGTRPGTSTRLSTI